MSTNSDSVGKNRTVLVTGGSGYLASWIVKCLIDGGHSVHTTVRDLSNRKHYAHLEQLSVGTGRLKIYAADLLKPGSFDEAMAGCDIVIHAASPFVIQGIKDVQRELLEPAVRGTENVLGSVNRVSSLRRVVLTSSIAAIYGDATELNEKRKTAFTEEDWNDTSSASYQPYPYSKTLAEREAWKIAREQTRWDLVVLNPGFILGPALGGKTDGTSQMIMRNFGDGTYKTGMIDVWYGFVDVRDVAEAHVKAAFDPQARGRYIISGKSGSMLEVASILRTEFGKRYPLPTRKVPKFLVWLVPSIAGFDRRFVSHNVGVPLSLDNAKSRKELGITYRPLETTVIEHFRQLFG
jgi:nucleoside-diphosphate-sugar epimerase